MRKRWAHRVTSLYFPVYGPYYRERSYNGGEFWTRRGASRRARQKDAIHVPYAVYRTEVVRTGRDTPYPGQLWPAVTNDVEDLHHTVTARVVHDGGVLEEVDRDWHAKS